MARAALLDLIRRGDSRLAGHIHDENMRKPYTISLINGGKQDREHAQHFGEGDEAEWRFTLLCEPAFEATLRRFLLSRDLPHIRLGTVTFAIADAFASGESHPDSGYTTVSDLTTRWDCSPAALPREITLDFLSPTTFNLGEDGITGRRRFRPNPDPRVLFSTLRKRWQKFGGAEPGDSADVWVDDHVEAEPIWLDFRRVQVERASLPGFVGRVRYRVYGDPTWLPLLHLLTDLAFWTGVGYQTTRGLGQVRRATET
jgi:CRISPR-associated endoribonuclease Cas6